jgi:flagellar biosynthesis protein FliR
MNREASSLINDWPQYLTAAVLVIVRLSGLMVFAPLFSSAAIAPRIKVGFVFAMTVLLAPAVAAVPNARVTLDMKAVLGELGVGLVFGLSLTLLNEALVFAGMLLGMQFSFSLVNLLDPNSKIETPVLGQMLGWLGLLVMIGAGLDRSLIAAVAGGIFLAGLQLAAPVIAAALAVEVTIALVARLSPQLPAMVVSIPVKTMVSYVVLLASLGVWPGWIERHFTALLDAAGRLIATS